MVDYLARDAAIVVRYQGGTTRDIRLPPATRAEAHLIPSGILHRETPLRYRRWRRHRSAVLGAGDGHHPQRGISLDNLRISGNAHVIMPYHRLLDTLEEERRGGSKIGTTGRGIGPAYADKAARKGLRISDLVSERMVERARPVIEEKSALLQAVYGAEALDVMAILDQMATYADQLRPYVYDTISLVTSAVADRAERPLRGGSSGRCSTSTTAPIPTSPPRTRWRAGPALEPESARATSIASSASTRLTRLGWGGSFPTELHDATGD